MKCTDKSFIINTTVLHTKRRFVQFDFMPTLKDLQLTRGLLVMVVVWMP